MLTQINKLTDDFYASPQLNLAEIKAAKEAGFDLIINNRPDGEEMDQPPHAEVAAAAQEAGIAYIYVPIGRMVVGAADLDAFDAAIAKATKTLAYCRTGTRSTIVRSLATARSGKPISDILAEAANGGYDMGGQRGAMEALQD